MKKIFLTLLLFAAWGAALFAQPDSCSIVVDSAEAFTAPRKMRAQIKTETQILLVFQNEKKSEKVITFFDNMRYEVVGEGNLNILNPTFIIIDFDSDDEIKFQIPASEYGLEYKMISNTPDISNILLSDGIGVAATIKISYVDY